MPSQPARPPRVVRLLAVLTLAALVVPVLPVLRAAIDRSVDTRSGEVAIRLELEQVVRLPIAASHVSLHWTGAPAAHLTLNVGRTPDRMSEDITFEVDADAPPPLDAPAVSYSDVIWADGARWARVRSDQPIEHLTIVAMDPDANRGLATDRVPDAAGHPALPKRRGGARPQPLFVLI